MVKINFVGQKSKKKDEKGNVIKDEQGKPVYEIKNPATPAQLESAKKYGVNQERFATKEEYENAKNELTATGMTAKERQEAEATASTNLQTNAQNLEQQGAFKETQQAQDLQTGVNVKENGVINLRENLRAYNPSIQALRSQAIFEHVNQGAISDMSLTQFQSSPEILADPTLSALIKSELDFEVLKSGEAKASKLGTLVESIPFLGGLARKYGGNLIQTPSSDIDDILGELTTIDGDIKLQQTYAANGGDPTTIFTNMKNYEDRISWLESKIKLLTAQSPELRANPEEVDKIMQQIQGIYSHITSARTAVTQAAINNLESNSMTDFMLLQRYKNAAKTSV